LTIVRGERRDTAPRGALSSVSRNGAVVAGILDCFGFGFGFGFGSKIIGPVAKLLPHFVARRNPLQLAAALSYGTEFACIHGVAPIDW
jgi:hypothetical protein